MPVPLYPKPGESKDDYLSRCVPALIDEGKTRDQAIGQCYGMWRHGKRIKDKLIRKLKGR